MEWFRWYSGTTEDGKLRVVAKKARVSITDAIAVWAMMMEDAANTDHWGVCERDAEFIGGVLDMEEEAVDRVVAAMSSKSMKMIRAGKDGLTLCNWPKRQYRIDAAMARRDRWLARLGPELFELEVGDAT